MLQWYFSFSLLWTRIPAQKGEHARSVKQRRGRGSFEAVKVEEEKERGGGDGGPEHHLLDREPSRITLLISRRGDVILDYSGRGLGVIDWLKAQSATELWVLNRKLTLKMNVNQYVF